MNPNVHKRRLTVAEVRRVLEYYNAALPGWRTVRQDTLFREAGPVLQGITIERLSGGEYRPTGYIRVLIAPEDDWVFELPQHLNVGIRQIDRRQDTQEIRERVVMAIRSEFVPRVDEPLVAENVLGLYEEMAYPSSPEAYSLAALNAYFGRDDRALFWCLQFNRLVAASGNSLQDHDRKRQSFLKELEGWLKTGHAKRNLERTLKEERDRWGLG